MGCYDNEAAVTAIGNFDDCLGRVSLGNMNGLGVDAETICSSSGISQCLLSRLRLARLILRRRLHQWRRPPGAGRGTIDCKWLCHGDYNDLRAHAPSEVQAMIYALLGKFRSVCRYENELDTRKNRLIFGMLGALAPLRHDDRRQAA